jgi:RNA polymerase sigma factor (sigma-70 family)
MIGCQPAAALMPTGACEAEQVGKFAMRLIRRKARRLTHCPGFTMADREDLEQELLLKVWEAAGRFDPRRSHPHAFVATVVERAAATLARDQKAVKRGHHLAHCSLGAPTCSADDPRLAPETSPSHFASLPAYEMDLALTNDLGEVLSRLPHELREVAEQLGTGSKRSIARTLGISRRVLEQRIDALRTHFVTAGLEENF